MDEPALRADFLSTFVPAHVHRLLQRRGGMAPTVAFDDEVEGAALVADIAGFTALTESLDAGDTEGADALSTILDGLFGFLSDLVEDHHGEVVHLAGDGLLAIWPVDSEADLAAAITQAAECGLRIQSEVAGGPALDHHRIRMRVGVGAGRLWLPVVGGEGDVWFAPVGGPPMRQIGTALDAARPGDVVVAAEAMTIAGDAIRGSATPNGLVRVDAVTLIRGQPPVRTTTASGDLDRFVPEIVAERAAAGMAERFSELREATSVFVKATWTEAESGNRLDRLQAAAARFQEVVRRFDGTITSLLLDEKGLSMIGTWGGSRHVHEDDPVRALRAAMSLAATMEDVTAAIGVAGGRTYLGDVGSQDVRRFMILGRAVNLAARLASPDRTIPIRCDATTMIAARRHVAFEERTPLHLKGVSEPTRVFRPVTSVDAIRDVGPGIIGRAAERRLLTDLLEEAVRGRGSFVVVEGEAGIGKSTLVRALLDAGDAHAVRRLVVRGSSLDQSTSYHPWRAVFQTLTTGLDPKEVLERALDVPDRAFAEAINEVLPGTVPSTGRMSDMPPQDRADTVRAVAASVFARLVGGAPLLLVLEDAHWYDSATWGVVEAVTGRCPHALTICVTRGRGRRLDPSEARFRAEATVLSLDRLTVDETVALACSRLDVPSIPRDLADLIISRTEGHPLYTEELIRSFRDAGVIQIVGPARTVEVDHVALDALALPAGVSAIIASRIDRLPLGHQSTLKVASVVGRDFTVGQIAATHPDAPRLTEIEAHLEEAMAEGILEARDQAEPGAYRFSHVLMVEAIYASLPAEPRRRIHRAVAETLTDHAGADAAVLGHHWSAAGEDAAAVVAFDNAAAAAFGSAGYREAAELLERADDLDSTAAPSRTARARRQALWGDALIRLGDLQGGHDHLLAAVRQVGMPMPRTPWRVGLGLSVQLLRQALHRVRTAPARDEARAERIAVAADAYWSMVSTTFGLQDAAGLVYSGLRATNEAERIPATATLARSYSFLAYFTGILDRRGWSERYHTRAVAAAAAADSPAALAEVMLNHAVMLIALGEWSAAEVQLDHAAESYRELGSRRDHGRTVAVIAYGRKHRGELESSLSLYRSLHDLESDDELLTVWVVSGMTQVLVRIGRLTEAIGIMRAHGRLFDEVGEFANGLSRLGFLALALWQEGRLDAAVDTALAGLEMMEGMESFAAPHAFDGYAEIARVLLEADEHLDEERIHRAAERAVRSLRTVARRLPIAGPRAAMTQATLLARRGRRRGARRHFDRAIQLASGLEMPYEQALAKLMMGRELGEPEVLRVAGVELAAIGATVDARLATAQAG